MENVEKIEVEEELLKEEDFSEEELEDENTDWKAKALELKGLNKRRATKLAKLKEIYSKSQTAPENKPNPEQPVKKEGFGYAELSYLTAKGIPDEDIDFVQENLKNTGKELRDLLTAKWFQSELKERKETRETKTAIPTGSKRSAQSNKDDVDYWISKGELPPNDVELRRKVLNARIKAEENKSKFASNPVIMGGS